MSKGSIFGIEKKYHTAIEIGKSYLKIAQAETSNNKGIVISKLISKPISGLSDEEISKVLADIVSANNIRVERLTAVISRDRVMVRYLRLPATKAEEIDNMLSFEVTRQIPYSQEEIVSDYKVITTDNQGYSKIMLAIVHKNEVTKLNDILDSIKKEPNQIRLSSEAILSWLRAVQEEELSYKGVCLLDVDTDNTEIAVIYDGRLEFSRVASIGTANISQGGPEVESWKRHLIDEIKASIGVYIKERGQDAFPITEFLVTGAVSVTEALTELIKEQMDTPSRSLNILPTLPLADEALAEEGISSDSSVCAVCGSLFLSEGLNLISAEQRKEEKVKLRTRRFVAISISTMIGVALLSACVLVRLYQKEQLLIRMKNILKQIEPQAKATEDKLKKLRVVKQQLSEGATSLDAIYHLYRLIPANISLVDFDYEDKSRMVRFRGTAGSISEVYTLAGILEDSDKFSRVETPFARIRRSREGEVVDFQISCNFMLED